jgi:hypothetical protein
LRLPTDVMVPPTPCLGFLIIVFIWLLLLFLAYRLLQDQANV